METGGAYASYTGEGRGCVAWGVCMCRRWMEGGVETGAAYASYVCRWREGGGLETGGRVGRMCCPTHRDSTVCKALLFENVLSII